ncbi:MAG: tetratricopeptide repeat protein [Deferribacteraceae bacterium]|nr:tetratricopeptide repeat protein [Deferribacteraceae bacterium]
MADTYHSKLSEESTTNNKNTTPKSEAEKIWEIADKAYNEKRYKDAIYYYEKSLALCGQDYECYAADYNGLGASYEDMGNNEKALYYYEKTVEAAKKLGDEGWIATGYFLTASIYNRLGINIPKAYEYLNYCKKIYEKDNDKSSLSITLHELGKTERMLGKFESAIDSFNKSNILYKELGDEFSIGANLNQLGITYSKMGQLEKAISYFKESLKVAEKVNDPEAISIVTRQLADAYADIYNYENAMKYYEEAINIQRKNHISKELGISLNSFGTLYMDLNRYENAKTLYLESLELANKQNDNPTKATILNNLGHIESSLGNIDNAFQYYNKAFEIENKLDRPYSLTYLLNNIGMAYFKIGNYEKALEYLKQALDIDKKLNNPHLIGTRLNNIGAVLLKQKKYREAEKVFSERKNLESKIKPNRLINSGLVETYILTGELDRALAILNEIPPTWKDTPTRHMEYYTQKGLILKEKGLLQEAAINFMTAINSIEDNRHLINSKEQFFAGGNYYNRLRPYREIIAVFYEMHKNSEYLVPGVKNVTSQSQAYSELLRTRRSAYDFLQFGNSPEAAAFYFSEMTKARTLLEAMSTSNKNNDMSEIPSNLRTTENKILNNLSSIETELINSYKSGEQKTKELIAKKEGLKKELDSLIAILRERYPRYAAINYPLPVTAEKLPLKENELLLEYSVTNDATYLFLVAKGGIKKIIKLPVSKKQLEEDIKAFLSPMTLKKPEMFSIEAAQNLYKLLLSEALENVDENTKVIIVPDGILGVLPFESLIIQKGNNIETSIFVNDRYNISYYQSATILALNRMFQKKNPKKLLFAIGNPVFTADDQRYIAWKEGKTLTNYTLNDKSKYAFRALAINVKWGATTKSENNKIEFPLLPETETEIKKIAKIMGTKPEPPDILFGVEANETNFKLIRPEDYKYLHFATHASLPGMIQGIKEPFILLGQVENKNDDGFLTLSEVSKMKINADLVVLSACVTGVGKEIEGEGVANFARAFQQAGANSVLVSLWEVASEPAVEYMEELYTNLKSGKSKTESVKLAKNYIKSKYKNPFYWAVFILHGEG